MAEATAQPTPEATICIAAVPRGVRHARHISGDSSPGAPWQMAGPLSAQPHRLSPVAAAMARRKSHWA